MRTMPDGLQGKDRNSPMTSAEDGELIGAVGDDERARIIELGSSSEFTACRDGRDYLYANRGSFSDTRGSFTVQIKRELDLNALDNQDNNYPRRTPGIRSRDRFPIDEIDRNRNRDRSQQEITVNVPGTTRSLDTGIDVRAGDPITITASGTIIRGRRIGQVGPDGATRSGLGINARPVPSAGVGALIAYIRMSNGQLSAAYLVGSSLSSSVPVDGRLILGINDDDFSDNGGAFSVRIRY